MAISAATWAWICGLPDIAAWIWAAWRSVGQLGFGKLLGSYWYVALGSALEEDDVEEDVEVVVVEVVVVKEATREPGAAPEPGGAGWILISSLSGSKPWAAATVRAWAMARA